MKRLSIRKQTFLFIALSSVVLVCIVVFLMYPAVQNILALQKTIKETHVFLENKYQSIQKAKKSVAALPDVQKDIAVYEEGVIASGEELAFITQLEKLAEKHSIDQNLSALFIDDPKKQSNLRMQKARSLYKFSFLNRGSYQNHLRYLEELERSPHYMFIDRIIFEKIAKPADPNSDVTVRFDGYVYAAH